MSDYLQINLKKKFKKNDKIHIKLMLKFYFKS